MLGSYEKAVSSLKPSFLWPVFSSCVLSSCVLSSCVLSIPLSLSFFSFLPVFSSLPAFHPVFSVPPVFSISLMTVFSLEKATGEKGESPDMESTVRMCFRSFLLLLFQRTSEIPLHSFRNFCTHNLEDTWLSELSRELKAEIAALERPFSSFR